MDRYSAILNQIEDISGSVFKRVIESGEYQKVGGFDKANTLQYVANYFNAQATNLNILTAQILGAPGSGKTRFTKELLPLLKNTVALATDEYNLGSREERRKKIEKRGTPLDEKDFDLLAEHVEKIKNLKPGEKIKLPGPYNSAEGKALVNGLTREVIGQFKILLIEGNFYVGHGGPVNVPLDALIYIHTSDKDRLMVRLARDSINAPQGTLAPEEIFQQFYQRQKIQDTPYTLPFMDISDILLFAKPTFEEDVISRFEYEIYYRKTVPSR